MFRKAVLFWSLLLFALLLGTLYVLTRVDDTDRFALRVIRERMPVSKEKNSGPSLALYSQHRENLRRDVWITKGADRLQAIHYSDIADLVANQADQELIEKMTGVHCIIQESQEKGEKQLVSFLRAHEAVYDYNRLALFAQPVQWARYQVSGQRLSEFDQIASEPLINGSSDRVEYQSQQVLLTGHVALNLADDLVLRCDRALIDRKDGHGVFESLEPSVVTVSGYYTDAEAEPRRKIPMQMQSRTIEIWMEDLRFIRHLVAEGEVCFNYDREWTAKGNRAVFRRNGVDPSFFAGTLELVGNQADECVVEHIGGSHVKAQQMILDVPNQELMLKQPHGILQPQSVGMEVAFQSDDAVWAHRQQLLKLVGDVSIRQGSHRTLTSRDEVHMTCRSLDGRMCLQFIECRGPTEMVWEEGRRIQCQGRSFVDLDQQKLLLTSPQGLDGQIAVAQQLAFEGPEGEMTGDQLTLSFAVKDGDVLPTLLVAEGHICVKRGLEEEGAKLQYALCDELHYTPTNHELLLKATLPHRVIFLDQQYDVKISAPAVKITRHPETGKETLKGLGDVHMTLLDQELARLRKRFVIKEAHEPE